MDQQLDLICGTPCYMAPELLSRKGYLGPRADQYALGVILYLLLQGNFPFLASNVTELYRQIQQSTPEYPHPISGEALNLVSSLLSINPKERLVCQQILSHPWLQE